MDFCAQGLPDAGAERHRGSCVQAGAKYSQPAHSIDRDFDIINNPRSLAHRSLNAREISCRRRHIVCLERTEARLVNAKSFAFLSAAGTLCFVLALKSPESGVFDVNLVVSL